MTFHIIDPPQLRVLKSQQQRVTALLIQVGVGLVETGREIARNPTDSSLLPRQDQLNRQADKLRFIRLELAHRIEAEQRRMNLPL